MTETGKTPKAAAILERARDQMRELSEAPDIARGAIGSAVFALIRAGNEVTSASIIAELEAAAAGDRSRTGLTEVMARGALKVMSDLSSASAG